MCPCRCCWTVVFGHQYLFFTLSHRRRAEQCLNQVSVFYPPAQTRSAYNTPAFNHTPLLISAHYYIRIVFQFEWNSISKIVEQPPSAVKTHHLQRVFDHVWPWMTITGRLTKKLALNGETCCLLWANLLDLQQDMQMCISINVKGNVYFQGLDWRLSHAKRSRRDTCPPRLVEGI